MANDRHQAPSYPLRITPELREQLQKAAEENMRSLNAEIMFRLINSFKESPNVPKQ